MLLLTSSIAADLGLAIDSTIALAIFSRLLFNNSLNFSIYVILVFGSNVFQVSKAMFASL
ncbi:hypothetical protein J6P52_02250 [bacterium]|nr:hypothetical protein [bacterium]